MDFDIVVIGAGPAGLSFARAMAGSGARIALIETQPEHVLAAPPFDGREIALTHISVRLMRELGLWDRIDPNEISKLREALVFNGASERHMRIGAESTDCEALGYLVPNHEIRRTAYESMKASDAATLIAGTRVENLYTGTDNVTVKLSNGATLRARLAVAADSRFSETRRMVGIPASMRDFGKAMMVCRLRHELPHNDAAWEWFDYGQTMAILPLNGNMSSLVLTLPLQEHNRLKDVPPDEFAADVTRRLRHRLGEMELASTRHVYPLVGVYAKRFVANRFAVIGDAAVGMHPVTAHGFNLGLLSQHSLATRLRAALASGADIASPALLAAYEREHDRASRGLYLGTCAIVSLFNDSRPPARLARKLALGIGDRLRPFKRAVADMLTQEEPPSGVIKQVAMAFSPRHLRKT